MGGKGMNRGTNNQIKGQRRNIAKAKPNAGVGDREGASEIKKKVRGGGRGYKEGRVKPFLLS